MTNILFVDVDGTLITVKDGDQYLPQSAFDGLAEVRRRGGLVYLCTGRSLAEAGTIGEVPVDGIIGAGGGFVIHRGEARRPPSTVRSCFLAWIGRRQ